METSGVSFTTFQFTGAAFTWWEAYERRRPVGAVPLTWQEFSVLFLEKYVPQSHREELRRQFEQLRQEDMTVTQYVMRFSELARHTIWLVPTDRERIRRLIDGLTFQLRIELVCSQDRVEREAKRSRGSGSFGGVPSGGQFHHGRGCPYRHAQTVSSVHRGASSGHGSHSSQ
ncbi:uncharacterized protein [Nicotiana tomentosiformis]|uniref:uncharacterized protein n=1 Tax=Nicotiana tomentosiformis TaxID=4098 RepID=UPI00388CD4F4